MKLIIRPYTAADAAVTRAIFYQSIHELAAEDYSRAQLAAWAPKTFSLQQWGASRERAQTFVATVDGFSAGFAALVAGSGQTLLGEMLVDMLFVRPPYHGHGIASALLTQVQEEARTRGATGLRVQASLTARGFFERHGFRVEKENVVSLHGEALINFTMTKRL